MPLRFKIIKQDILQQIFAHLKKRNEFRNLCLLVLGPLLFIINLSGISSLILFAKLTDDKKTPIAIRAAEDTVTHQNELNVIYGWADENNNKLNNVSKLQVLHYGTYMHNSDQNAYLAPGNNNGKLQQNTGLGTNHVKRCIFHASPAGLLNTFSSADGFCEAFYNLRNSSYADSMENLGLEQTGLLLTTLVSKHTRSNTRLGGVTENIHK